MKRFIKLILIAMIFAIPSLSWAVGSVTISASTITVQNEPTRRVITLSWVADASAATVPDTTINAITYEIEGWYLYSAETNPGSPAPTANYDMYLNDADGFDIAGNLLENRHTTTTELVNIGTATHGYPLVRGNITFTLSGNNVNSAVGTCILTLLAN